MGQIHKISSEEAKKMVDEGAVYIDVREPAEHRSKKIPGTVNIPLSKISLKAVKANKTADQKVVMHCKSGMRSGKACEKIAKESDFDVYTVEGGIEDWHGKGFDIEEALKKILPLDRQVQLAVSVIIIVGLVMYYFAASPVWLMLPLFAGLGLFNAAVTGRCPMASLLALMPWNK